MITFKAGDRVRFGDQVGVVTLADVTCGPGLIFEVQTDDGNRHLVGKREMVHEE